MKYYRLALLVILSAMFIGLSPAHGQEPMKSDPVSEILDWLPTDSETLIVANGPFLVLGEPTSERTGVELARSMAMGMVTEFQDGFFRKQLKGRKIEIAVEASRRFTSPKGLGMMPFEGCQILKFDDGEYDALNAAVERYFERAPKMIQLGETKAAVFTEKSENDDWTLFVAHPRPGVLLCATSESFLRELLARMKERPVERAFPGTLAEWDNVDSKAAVWGIRHYRKEFAATDPSSPLRSKAAANVPDPKAIGFVFSVDEDAAKPARARYLSTAENAVEIVARVWDNPGEGLTPTFTKVKPNVVEIGAPFDGIFMFVLIGYLGHGVYL